MTRAVYRLGGGQEVINRQFLSFLGQAVSEFSQHKMNVSEVILPANTVRQVWFKVEGRETQIRMTVDSLLKPRLTGDSYFELFG